MEKKKIKVPMKELVNSKSSSLNAQKKYINYWIKLKIMKSRLCIKNKTKIKLMQ